MKQWNYSNARAQLTVEITRRGRESAVIISKTSYEAYKKAEYDVAYYKISVSKENSEA
ncbi:type II toxin-antitoxin system prevent-host-death family antitoxin [Acinetobacter baumannii]|nr:type II toxin-antitoxin system prevent-host-death family antitoxin [Acinetobacter baumannii]